MGLDHGTRRVGLALSDPLRLTAQPFGVLRAEGEELDLQLRRIVEEQEVDMIVVGLPVSLEGDEGEAAEAARSFAERVAEATPVPVELWDERFTTVTAESALIEGRVRRRDRRHLIDKVAAAVMLQSYLDRR